MNFYEALGCLIFISIIVSILVITDVITDYIDEKKLRTGKFVIYGNGN